jgi:quinol monooxygenase YgiN
MKNTFQQVPTAPLNQPSQGGTLLIAGRVYVAPTEVEQFVAEAQQTIPVALANEGCLLIAFTLDNLAAGSMLVLEHWRSQQALEAHLAQPEVVALFTKWGSRMRNEVRKFDAHNERSPRE